MRLEGSDGNAWMRQKGTVARKPPSEAVGRAVALGGLPPGANLDRQRHALRGGFPWALETPFPSPMADAPKYGRFSAGDDGEMRRAAQVR